MNATIRSGFGAILISAVLAISAVFGGGCQHMGPTTIVPDRLNYNEAVCESWKQQMLLNIVRLRHNDAPVFIEVGSIIGGYSIEHKGSAGWIGQFQTPYQQTLTAGGESKFTDRPTITYTPLTGSKFIQSLMKPVDPPTLLFLIQSGWNAETLFHMVVQSINGRKNRSAARGVVGKGDPEFFEVAKLVGAIQRRGGVGMRIEKDADGASATVLFFHSRNMDAETREMSLRIKKILGLDPQQEKFKITYGGVAADGSEISILSRSIISALIALSSQANVPPEVPWRVMTNPEFSNERNASRTATRLT